ncbi:MAG: hypothetical protein J6W82_12000 [Bacteroidales bacterium]|nr:hypothetical protein [Bacteroidales bacterium]
MKKLFLLIASAVCAGALAVSCNDPLMDLDGTKWHIYMTEDRLNGKVVSTDFDTDDVEFTGTRDNFQITIKVLGAGTYTYGPEDATILKSTAAELVFDLLYYEYDDLKMEDCVYDFTYKGTKIYRYDYLYHGAPDTIYVYFKPNGKAVDVGGYTYDGEDYWYDSSRYYCRRSK